MAKLQIGTRVDESWVQEIDQTCSELGITRSDWLAGVVAAALKRDKELVPSLAARVAKLESWQRAVAGAGAGMGSAGDGYRV